MGEKEEEEGGCGVGWGCRRREIVVVGGVEVVAMDGSGGGEEWGDGRWGIEGRGRRGGVVYSRTDLE